LRGTSYPTWSENSGFEPLRGTSYPTWSENSGPEVDVMQFRTLTGGEVTDTN
jgi:hypothetical protein